MLLRPKGFTLLELIIVIVIIGILATLGFVSYTELMERARDVEAIGVLKAWMNNVEIDLLEKGSFQLLNILDLIPSGVPLYVCSKKYYSKYFMGNTSVCPGEYTRGTVRLTATRCLAGEDGKLPLGAKPRYVTIEKHFGRDNRTEIRVTNTNPDLQAPWPEPCP